MASVLKMASATATPFSPAKTAPKKQKPEIQRKLRETVICKSGFLTGMVESVMTGDIKDVVYIIIVKIGELLK